MRRKLLGYLGVVVMASAVIYVARPVGHVPPYDANLTRLAESELEGYCAGATFMRTRGAGDADAAAECRATAARSGAPDMDHVELSFCRGASDAGLQMSVEECVPTLRQYELWPTYDGGLTDAWNRARPYPGSVLAPEVIEEDGSRTGRRPPTAHVGPSRDDEMAGSPSPSASPTTEEGA